MTAPRSLAKPRKVIGYALLALLLVIPGWAPHGRSAAQGIEGDTQAPLAFSSGGTISFQGQLTTLAGAVLNGDYNLRFAIYDAPSAGNKKWPAGAYEEHMAVPVTGGLFSVQLGSIGGAIDASVFNGGGDRYLQVWVCTTVGAGCVTYDDMGRLPVSSGAYAQTLALPAALESSSASTLLSVTNTGSGGALSGLSFASSGGIGVSGRSESVFGKGVSGYAAHPDGGTDGVFGQAVSTSGRGVRGYASATSGANYGVYGEAAGSSGSGVYGYASSASGATFGVYGKMDSPSGYGVYGYAPSTSGTTFGVYGRSDSGDGRGVVGLASATSGSTRGVIGTANSPDGTGVLGLALAYSGLTNGVRGESASSSGRGVYGYASATTGATYGVSGLTASSQGYGVFGEANATSGTTYGVFGQSISPNGYGVYGRNSNVGGQTYGVYGEAWSTSGRGVYGIASATSGSAFGVQGQTTSTGGRGVYGWADTATGTNYGVYGRSDSINGYGVYGVATAGGASQSYGVYGISYTASGYGGKFDGYGADAVHVENLGSGRGIQVNTSSDTAIWAITSAGLAGVDGRSALSTGRGVYGYGTATTGANSGVYGRSASSDGRGVYGWAETTTGVNYGVYGRTSSASGYAGYFQGNLHTTGTLTKAAGAFKIDHPLDPANQYLSHSFVESPDMKNIYDGVVILDDSGAATVTLPDWFEALNGGAEHRSDFRYQLTPIGAAMPDLHIGQKIQGNTFGIAGGKPSMEVSWQVTGIRHDPYAEQNRIAVETDKPAGERGTYLYPQGYGRPEQQGLNYEGPEILPASSGN